LHNQYRHFLVAWVVPFALVVLGVTVLVKIVVERHFLYQKEGREEDPNNQQPKRIGT